MGENEVVTFATPVSARWLVVARFCTSSLLGHYLFKFIRFADRFECSLRTLRGSEAVGGSLRSSGFQRFRAPTSFRLPCALAARSCFPFPSPSSSLHWQLKYAARTSGIEPKAEKQRQGRGGFFTQTDGSCLKGPWATGEVSRSRLTQSRMTCDCRESRTIGLASDDPT